MKKRATTVYLWPDQPAAITDMAERDLCAEAEVIRAALDMYLYPDGPPGDVLDLRGTQMRRASKSMGNAARRSALRDRRVDAARSMWDDGADIDQIAESLGVSTYTAKKYIGAQLRRMRRVRKAGKMASEGASIAQIAEKLRVTTSTARKYVAEYDEGSITDAQ